MQCKFCQKIIGGIYRFKHHLACTRKDVEPCQHVPEDVKKIILNVLVKNQEVTEKKRKAFQYIGKDEDNCCYPIFDQCFDKFSEKSKNREKQ